MIPMAVVLDNVKCHLVRHRPPVLPSVHRRITDLQVCSEFLLGNSQGGTHIQYCIGKIHGILIHIAYYNICYPFNEVIIVPVSGQSAEEAGCVYSEDQFERCAGCPPAAAGCTDGQRGDEPASFGGSDGSERDSSVWRASVQAAGQRQVPDHNDDCAECCHGEYSPDYGIPVPKKVGIYDFRADCAVLSRSKLHAGVSRT